MTSHVMFNHTPTGHLYLVYKEEKTPSEVYTCTCTYMCTVSILYFFLSNNNNYEHRITLHVHVIDSGQILDNSSDLTQNTHAPVEDKIWGKNASQIQHVYSYNTRPMKINTLRTRNS